MDTPFIAHLNINSERLLLSVAARKNMNSSYTEHTKKLSTKQQKNE